MKKHFKTYFPFAIAICIFGAALYFDTRQFRNALDDWRRAQSLSDLQKESQQISENLNALMYCTAMRDTLRVLSVEARDCLLAAMPKVTTEVGAAAFAMASSTWLNDHPNDDVLRQSTLRTIEAGWEDLRRSIPNLTLQERVSAAHDRSILLRATGGTYFTNSLIDTRTKILEDAELSLSSPDLSKKFIQRRLEIFTKKS